ncbi:hypothetical protein R1sor_010119 [Riccia sorocarpa]|uniref:Sulfatase-modifying factor enzyme domain-containing protein n=1 Tax=Riccia sorocarpa TaxID=122646 RepID=A0ABD3HX68_9MARC
MDLAEMSRLGQNAEEKMPPTCGTDLTTAFLYKKKGVPLLDTKGDLMAVGLKLENGSIKENGVNRRGGGGSETEKVKTTETSAGESESVKQSILMGLQRESNKEVPVRFLYDDRGSELYEEITKLEEYYPFQAEEDLLSEHADEIASHIPQGSILVELGCGTARKTARLLNAIVARHGRCRFAGIDISSSFVDEARCNLMLSVQGHLRVDLVAADNMEGLREIRAKYPDDSICVVWLGSSVSNYSEEEAVKFFQQALDAVKTRCRLFLCTDLWKNEEILRAAYHDKHGVTEAFIKNGMRNALGKIGYLVSADDEKSWIYEVEVNPQLKQVEMYLRFPEGLTISDRQINIRSGERVLMEISRKFTPKSIRHMTETAGFHLLSAWHNRTYGAQLLLDEFEAITQCWQDTDVLFDSIPDWTRKPIDVRHPFLFYYGHLIAFTKIKLFPEEPVGEFDCMFSRGVDPNVLDPSECHSHPAVPEQWPERDAIVSYARANRTKVLEAVRRGEFKGRSKLINFILEHDRMHHETLAYMIAQERKATFERNVAAAQLPPGHMNAVEPPSTMSIINSLEKSKMVSIERGKVILGAHPSEAGFLWDNEYPPLETSTLSSFYVSSRPVSIAEFHRFVKEGGYEKESLWEPEDYAHFKEKGYKYPATWSLVEGEFFVHEFQATNHWSKVAHDPVFVSLSEAEAFCKWLGCRIFTETEYQRVLDVDPAGELVQQMKHGGYEWTSSEFEGFPGFEPMPEYPQYSTDFFDGRHFVLKGSSPVTHPSLKRDSFRNYYQRQYRYVFAKFRCCR